MSILVAGKLVIKAGYRAAREDSDCCAFSVSLYSSNLNRVNVCEQWAKQAAFNSLAVMPQPRGNQRPSP